MRHTYYYIVTLLVAILVSSCEGEMDKDVNLSVSAEQTDYVSTVGDTIIAKAGEPVNFLFSGDPDYITFYSGEVGSKYIYRNRTEVAAEDIESSTLSFKLTYQYGVLPDLANNEDAVGLISMFISDTFPGMSKSDFTADSVLVEGYDWNTLVADEDLPQTVKGNSESKADEYEIDMLPYVTSTFTIAIRYWGKYVLPLNSDTKNTQPKAWFYNMKITNKMKDSTTTEIDAANFGMTPLNMLCHLNLDDQTKMTTNREYGSVSSGSISGLWTLGNIDSGTFFIQSSSKGKHVKYSWLVSDPIKINSCTPDQGVAIKSLNYALGNYSYTYSSPGVYTATFVATNANYKHESQMIKEVTVKVVE